LQKFTVRQIILKAKEAAYTKNFYNQTTNFTLLKNGPRLEYSPEKMSGWSVST
jgi:hypothetical protein